MDDLWPRIRERFPQNGFKLARYHKPADAEKLSEQELEEFLTAIINTPGQNVVYMTVESQERAALIKAALARVKIECIDPLDEAVSALARVSKQTPVERSALDAAESQHIRKQMAAILFSNRCDDGENMDEAFAGGDMFLVGGSRAGKTGAAAILALDGVRVGNVPFSIETADYIAQRLKPLMAAYPNVPVVALRKDVGELSANRRARMRLQLGTATPEIWQQSEENYFGAPAVARELRAFERFCQDVGISLVVDTTRCQPEEVAARIINTIKEKPAGLGS